MKYFCFEDKSRRCKPRISLKWNIWKKQNKNVTRACCGIKNKFWSLSVWLICRVYGSTTFDNFDLKNRKKFKIFVTLNYAGCHTHVGRGGNFSSQWSRTGSFKIVQIVKLLQVKQNFTFFAHISIKSAGAWKVRIRHLNVTKYNKSFSCKRFI